MISITEAKNKLPMDFVENLYTIFSTLTVDKIITGMLCKRNTTIRVNTLKLTIRELMEILKRNNIKFDRVLWYNDALIIKNVSEKQLQMLNEYKEGKFYIQSLSSMIPPLVLEPKQGEKILDMTAAPGSKTTQISSLMDNKGYILANELDKIRVEQLKYNIKCQGASIVEVRQGRGEDLGKIYLEQFDKVLLDTPCSGEGRFLLENPQTYRSWSEKTVKELVKTQKRLFKSAYESVKKNGTIVYSTCTINQKENEEILNWALNNFSIKIENINLNINETISGFTEQYNQSIAKAIRILPSKNMEGFFIAKIKKI